MPHRNAVVKFAMRGVARSLARGVAGALLGVVALAAAGCTDSNAPSATVVAAHANSGFADADALLAHINGLLSRDPIDFNGIVAPTEFIAQMNDALPFIVPTSRALTPRIRSGEFRSADEVQAAFRAMMREYQLANPPRP